MATVRVGPPKEQISIIDPDELVKDEEMPAINPETGVPAELRAFVVNVDPRMVVIPQFASASECQHLLDLVDGYWIPSTVGRAAVDKEHLENQRSKTRTSWSCMLRHSQTATVEWLEHRLARIAGLPIEQLERLNMVRYSPGEFFGEHHDGKFRPRTVFLYLNELAPGAEGETYFSQLGLKFTPRRGCAIVWSNATPEGIEDSRMVHQGLPPTVGVKFGVNCFFNDKNTRLVNKPEASVPFVEASVVDLRSFGAERREDSISGDTADEEKPIVTYVLWQSPKLSAVPYFLSSAEAEHFARLGAEAMADLVEAPGPKKGEAGIVLRALGLEESPEVEAIEGRIAAVAAKPLETLAPLRLSRPGRRLGACNRGCGGQSAVVCLSEEDEVFFPKLGLRLLMRRGDLITFTNSDVETGPIVMEDMRTMRVHVQPDGAPPPVCLEAFFHETAIRETLLQHASALSVA